MNIKKTPLLDNINSPDDFKNLSDVELKELADELRQETIHSVSKTGGHLGAGLGVVELTVALHSIFDAPKDKIIWDVGHQSYPHKILTGRRSKMGTLRQKDGLSGFAKIEVVQINQTIIVIKNLFICNYIQFFKSERF